MGWAPRRTLEDLPPEIQLLVARYVHDARDRACLWQALPSLRTVLSAEELFRSFLGSSKEVVTYNGLLWLNRLVAAAGIMVSASVRPYMGDSRNTIQLRRGIDWVLLVDGNEGARVRVDTISGHALHFEGEQGAERLVRIEKYGYVQYYEGERGAVRMVREERPDGRVVHFVGKKNAERKVREEWPDGCVVHFEGDKNAERVVRVDRSVDVLGGRVDYLEGDRGIERIVRVEWQDGRVFYFEGEKGAERKVRVALPDGGVWHFEGERFAERMVRIELPDN